MDGEVCNKNYHQKKGLVRQLKIVHHQKSFDTSKVQVLDKKECVFGTKDNYAIELEECNMNNEMVNDIVNNFGEAIYE